MILNEFIGYFKELCRFYYITIEVACALFEDFLI